MKSRTRALLWVRSRSTSSTSRGKNSGASGRSGEAASARSSASASAAASSALTSCKSCVEYVPLHGSAVWQTVWPFSSSSPTKFDGSQPCPWGTPPHMKKDRQWCTLPTRDRVRKVGVRWCREPGTAVGPGCPEAPPTVAPIWEARKRESVERRTPLPGPREEMGRCRSSTSAVAGWMCIRG
jgi:hypothetical protein